MNCTTLGSFLERSPRVSVVFVSCRSFCGVLKGYPLGAPGISSEENRELLGFFFFFFFRMENMLGLLKIRVKRGINLAIRDARSSDPYVVISLQNQRLKTRVVKDNCNPVWNDELTLPITDPSIPIHLSVYDKDTLTGDDKMGEAEIDLRPYVDAVRMRLENLPTPTTVSRVQPCRTNYLADESCIVWVNGKIVQDMVLRLKNVESGEVEIQIEWIDVPGGRGI